jgi:hypothetical protein
LPKLEVVVVPPLVQEKSLKKPQRRRRRRRKPRMLIWEVFSEMMMTIEISTKVH